MILIALSSSLKRVRSRRKTIIEACAPLRCQEQAAVLMLQNRSFNPTLAGAAMKQACDRFFL